jgi:hypothetical protein
MQKQLYLKVSLFSPSIVVVPIVFYFAQYSVSALAELP